jgi:membrane glycosyltransferase
MESWHLRCTVDMNPLVEVMGDAIRQCDWSRTARRAERERAGWLALLVVLIALAGTALFGRLLSAPGLTLIGGIAIALFGLLFGHLTCAFLLAVTGFLRGMRRGSRSDAPAPALRSGTTSRTAVVMVIRHEEVPRVLAGIRAMFWTLAESGPLESYTVFVLSDSTDPRFARAEEQGVRALVRELGAAGRIVYRRRATNEGRKSGNLVDFCARWGRQFEYMVVLDADSLLDGRTIRELVRRMDAAPRVGILQTATRPINRESLFGRIQQFAAGLYGPLIADGLDFWLGRAAPYWGHNAIIRVAPFMRHCRLPRLSGSGPLGGEILSHDFVEGALMRRAGWDVRLAVDLDSSYEEIPANLIAYAARDQRWCQGDLQNLRLVTLPGLSIASRLTLVVGALGYLCAPAWTLFLVFLCLHLRPSLGTVGVERSPGALPLSAVVLPATVVSFLFVPKILAIIRAAARPGGMRSLGGARAVLLSLVGESLFAALLTPIQLMLHTQFVVAIFCRRTVGWTAQPRRDSDTTFADAARAHGIHTAAAGIIGIAAYAIDPGLPLWLVPATAGLALSIPISMVSSYRRWGQRARDWGLFLIPEEIAPPRLLTLLDGCPTTEPLADSLDRLDLAGSRLSA